MQELTSRKELYRLRHDEEKAYLSSRNMVSSCRLTSADLDLFFQEFRKHEHKPQLFRKRLDSLTEAPQEPAASELQRLQDHWPKASKQDSERPPSWLKAVAVQRDLFTNAVVTQSAEPGSSAWLILYIKKSPVQAAVLELKVEVPHQLPPTSCSLGDPWPPKNSTWAFSYRDPSFSLLTAQLFQDGPVFVITNCFWAEQTLVSLEGALKWRPGCTVLPSRLARSPNRGPRSLD